MLTSIASEMNIRAKNQEAQFGHTSVCKQNLYKNHLESLTQNMSSNRSSSVCERHSVENFQ
jgi:hypothetical protein